MEVFCKGLGFVSGSSNPALLVAVFIIIAIVFFIYDTIKER